MEVILSNFKDHPSCPHGPCLLFERYKSDGLKSGRRFFACSACRFRSDCSFFQWADDELPEAKKALWDKIKEEKSLPYSHEDYIKRLEIFKSLPTAKQFCKTCSLLILDQSENHSGHNIFENVSLHHLLEPTLLFEWHENKKVEAQYYFEPNTTSFLVSLLKDLKFSKLVSIGVPKVHEYVISNKVNGISSLLMDIDHRYMQFFGPEKFCHYNLFNNYFFGGKKSKKKFKNFLSENEDDKVAIILDPPFGGLVDAISFTLKKINKWWQRRNNKVEENVPIIWVFPYFLEGRILKNFPDMKMMDYKVEYVNHKKFKENPKKSSPVRIFTNIEASHFVLPAEYGYRFCADCDRYVSEENQHCLKCNACTTKHGKTYHHCDYCKQCVKSSFIHCQKCDKCGLLSKKDDKICQDCQCNSNDIGEGQILKCFKCSGVGHKKRNCPEGLLRHNKRKKLK